MRWVFGGVVAAAVLGVFLWPWIVLFRQPGDAVGPSDEQDVAPPIV